MGLRSGLWQCLAALSTGYLGAISDRKMGLGAILRLDMGFLRTMGLGAISLWQVVLLRQQLVLVAWTSLCRLSPAVVSGICLLRRLWTPRWLRLWVDRMVPRWPPRSVLSLVRTRLQSRKRGQYHRDQ